MDADSKMLEEYELTYVGEENQTKSQSYFFLTQDVRESFFKDHATMCCSLQIKRGLDFYKFPNTCLHFAVQAQINIIFSLGCVLVRVLMARDVHVSFMCLDWQCSVCQYGASRCRSIFPRELEHSKFLKLANLICRQQTFHGEQTVHAGPRPFIQGEQFARL